MAVRAQVDGDLAVLLKEATQHLTFDTDGSLEQLREGARADHAWLRGEIEESLSLVPSRDDVLSGIPVRWYGPELTEDKDVIVYLHGGGWMVGDLDSYDPDVRRLAVRSGCSVVAVEYRRSPEHPFPAGLNDCVAVISDVAVMPHRGLAIAGDSAGGHLALGACVELAAAVRIDAVLALYPVIDPGAIGNNSYVLNGDGFLLTTDAMAYYWRHYAAPDSVWRDPRLNLSVADLHAFPATVIVSADYDPLRDEAREFALRLVAADIDVAYLPQPGLTHGFQQMAPRIPAAVRALDAAYDALVTSLRRSIQRRSAARRVDGDGAKLIAAAQ